MYRRFSKKEATARGFCRSEDVGTVLEPHERQIEVLDCKAVTLLDHNRKPVSRYRCTVEVRSEDVGEDWLVSRAVYNSAIDSLAGDFYVEESNGLFLFEPLLTLSRYARSLPRNTIHLRGSVTITHSS